MTGVVACMVAVRIGVYGAAGDDPNPRLHKLCRTAATHGGHFLYSTVPAGQIPMVGEEAEVSAVTRINGGFTPRQIQRPCPHAATDGTS